MFSPLGFDPWSLERKASVLPMIYSAQIILHLLLYRDSPARHVHYLNLECIWLRLFGGWKLFLCKFKKLLCLCSLLPCGLFPFLQSSLYRGRHYVFDLAEAETIFKSYLFLLNGVMVYPLSTMTLLRANCLTPIHRPPNFELCSWLEYFYLNISQNI